MRNPAIQPRSRRLRSRCGIQRRAGPPDASRTLFADPAGRYDGRDERLSDGAAPESRSRNGPGPRDLLHREGLRGRHGGRAEHRSRRLHHQTLFGPRSAGPRAQCTAPHVRRTRRIRKHPLRRSGDRPPAQSLHARRQGAATHQEGVRNPGSAALEPGRDLFTRGDPAPHLERRGDRPRPHGRREHHTPAP